MNISDAIRTRQSIRSFTSQTVSQEKIRTILECASHAPSGANSQPWQVAVVTGRKKEQLSAEMIAAFAKGAESSRDYTYYPEKWVEPFKKRRVACGMQLYETLGIERADKDKRLEQWQANYRCFDAPVMLLFFSIQALPPVLFLITACLFNLSCWLQWKKDLPPVPRRHCVIIPR